MKWEEDEDKDYVIMTKEDERSNSSGSTEAEDQDCPKVLLETDSNVSYTLKIRDFQDLVRFKFSLRK